MKAHGGCGCKGPHIFTAKAQGRGRVARPMVGRLYPGKTPSSFYRRLSGHQDLSGHEGVKKNLHTSARHSGSNSAVQHVAQRFAA